MKTFPFVKQTWLPALLLCCAMLPQTTWAQCPNDNTPVSANPVTPPCDSGLETIATGVSGGQYVPVNVVNGRTYTFETCGTNEFDTEMTLYEDDGTFIDHNDDACGTSSRITFTPNFSGVVRVLIDETGCVSNNDETSVLASCVSGVCDITSVSFGNVSACNDNGTPSNPSDDFFTATVFINFVNPPATGSLQIEPGGDAISSHSIPVANLVGNSHSFTNVQLKADGTQTVIEAEFTVPANQCVQTAVGPTVASCSNAICDFSAVTFTNIGPCDDNGTPSNPADDTFTCQATVTYSNSTTGAIVQMTGGDVSGSASEFLQVGQNLTVTVTGIELTADGQPTDVPTNIVQSFFGTPICSVQATGPSVASCSNAPLPCEIIGYTFNNIGPCNDNGTPSNPADDFFEVDVDILYSNSSNGFMSFSGADVINPSFTFIPTGTNLTLTLTNRKLRADGQATDILAEIIQNPGNVVLCSLPGTGPAVSECSNGGSPSCEVIGFTFANISGCNNNGTPNDASDDFFNCDVSLIYSNPFTNSVVALVGPPPLLGVPGNGAPAGIGSNLTHVFQNVKFRANGQPVTFNGVVEHPQFTPCSTLPGTGPAVNACPCPSVTFGIGGTSQTVECDGSGNTAQFNAWLGAGGFANVNPSSGTIVSITHGTPTVNNLCGNGKQIIVLFTFTNDCGNSANIGGQFRIEDHTPPTITCPAAVQVSCFEQIPPANTAQVTGLTDACGSTPITVAHVSDASGPDGICDNDFTITRTYRATDVCSNSATCTQTITIRDQTPPTITCAAQTTPLECPATPVFTPPTASDNCTGNVAVTFNDVTVPGACPGTFTTTRTWRATDPCGNFSTCARSITVRDVTPPPVPANTASTVACPAQAIAPVPPTVLDACAGAITPTGPVITNAPNPLACEGTRTFTFTFTDCSGNASQWSHTYTIEREPFTINTPNGSATVDCPDDTDNAPIPPTVTSNCGEVLTPVLANTTAKPGCEGHRVYTFRYTDCEGNTADWLFTYQVEYPDFAIPASETESVECPSLATQPSPPTVFDNCGKLLTPTGPVVTSLPNAQGCEASRQYAWTYKDCEGNTHVWSKTFHFLYSADFFTFGDETNVVACLAHAVQPFPPTLYDACGNEIHATLTNVTENIMDNSCKGWRRFDFVYTGCGGHSHPWSYTYEINDDEAPLGSCPAGNGPLSVNVSDLDCIEDVPCPDDHDFSGKIEELLMAGDYFDVCSGNDLTVTLESASDLWECSDLDPTGASADGIYTFGRSFRFRIADPCGNVVPGGCEVTYSGQCLPIRAFRQEDWGITGGLPGHAVSPATTDVAIIEDLLKNGDGSSNPLVIGGSHRSLTVTDPDCVATLLPGTAGPGALANCHQTNCTGPTGVNCNPMGIGGMKNSLAANAIALTLNLRFNNEYNGLSLNGLRNQSLGCLALGGYIAHCPTEATCQLRIFDGSGTAHSFPYTLGGLLDLADLFLDGNLGLSTGQQGSYATAINEALKAVNAGWDGGQAQSACGAGNSVSPGASGSSAFGNEVGMGRGIAIGLSPNPASRYVVLQMVGLDEGRNVQVEVFNILGNRLIFNDLGKTTSLQHRIELGGLKTGMYLVRASVEGHRPLVQKLFVSQEGGAGWK